MSTMVITGPGPTQLPPLVNDVKQWDALLTYQAASRKPGIALEDAVALARAVGFDVPANMPQPWARSTPAERREALAQFNAVIDALALFSTRRGATRIQPRDVTVNDLFAFQAPQAGYFVRFSAAGVSHNVAVYRR